MAWIEQRDEAVHLALRVTPRSRRDEVAGVHGDRLRVRLQSPPVDGKANRALVRFLGRALAVPGSAVVLIRGERGREKTVAIEGRTVEDIRRRLAIPSESEPGSTS